MRRRSAIVFLPALSLLFTACSSGPPTFSLFHDPSDIAASTSDVAYAGRTARFVYVVDAYTRGLTVVDQQTDTIVDTDANPSFPDTCVPVGGRPSALVLQDRVGFPPRIFVADQDGSRIVAFDAVPPADPQKNVLEHSPVALGATAAGLAGRPLFRDTGAVSNPSLAEIIVDPSVAKTEYWFVEFLSSSDGYRVTGSKSGIQTARAKEGTAYLSDDGAISFTITAGGLKTNNGDRFEFGTTVASPIDLRAVAGQPIALQSDGTFLYAVTLDPTAANPPSVVVIDLATFAISAVVPLIDGSGKPVVPSGAAIGDGHLYISNSAAPTFFDVTASAPFPVAVFSSSAKSRAVGYDPAGKIFYLLSSEDRMALPFDPTGGVLSPIRLSYFGSAFVPYTLDSTPYALIPTLQGTADVLNAATRTRIDANVTEGTTQSRYSGIQFFDQGAVSAPQLISVTTRDDVTRSERWQLTYEGVIPASEGLSVEITGNQLTGATAAFQTWGVVAGDLVVIRATGEEITVASVASEGRLALASGATGQGSQTIGIRPAGSYLVVGSQSGVQKERAKEQTPYVSDEGAAALTIRGSRTQPTTRGDFFTFVTTEGIDPIPPISNARLARKAAIFTPHGSNYPTAYLIHEGALSITAVNLRSLRERRTIP
ncbi:MAG: hypothetical protein V1495_06505 [Pseudomonadota bacterium]